LREDVAGHLAPFGRHLDSLGLKNNGAVRVADLAAGNPKWYRLVRIATGRRKPTLDVHFFPRCPTICRFFDKI
jgi:hypothetical protein